MIKLTDNIICTQQKRKKIENRCIFYCIIIVVIVIAIATIICLKFQQTLGTECNVKDLPVGVYRVSNIYYNKKSGIISASATNITTGKRYFVFPRSIDIKTMRIKILKKEGYYDKIRRMAKKIIQP